MSCSYISSLLLLSMYCLVKFREIFFSTGILNQRTPFTFRIEDVNCPQNCLSFNHFLPVCRAQGRSLILQYSQPPPLAAPTFLLCHQVCVGRQLVCDLRSPSMEWVLKLHVSHLLHSAIHPKPPTRQKSNSFTYSFHIPAAGRLMIWCCLFLGRRVQFLQHSNHLNILSSAFQIPNL